MDRVLFSTVLHHRITPVVVNHDTNTFYSKGDVQ